MIGRSSAPEARLSRTSIWIALTVLTLSWGAGAFGSPYAWAYGPLMIASASLGMAGLVIGRGPVPRALVCAVFLLAAAAGLQLLPLAPEQVARWSPAALAIHRDLNLQFATGAVDRITLSIDPSRTRLGLMFLIAFFILLVGTCRVLSREGARSLAIAITSLGVALAMIGIVQRATYEGKVYGFWELQQGGSPFGPFINRNHFAGWMLMAIPLAIGVFASVVSRGMRGTPTGVRERLLWFASPDASKAILIGFSILTMSLALVLTLSRSGIMSLAGALLFAAVVMARRQASLQQRLVIWGYVIFTALTVTVWAGLDQIAKRFDVSDPTVAALSGRPQIWADTIEITRTFALTGTGLNTYGISTLYYQTAQPGQHLREAHSDYLQLAAEGGVLLGIPIVVAVAVFVRTIRSRLRQDVGSIWWVRMGAATGLLAIATQSLVEFSLQMPGNAVFFAVLAGITLHDS